MSTATFTPLATMTINLRPFVPRVSIDDTFRDRVVNALTSINLKHIADGLVSNDTVNGRTAAEVIINLRHDIARAVADDDRNLFDIVTLVEGLTEKDSVTLTMPFNIPYYNLPHYGNCCHISACINVLSSTTYVLAKMVTANELTEECKALMTCILNAYSMVDIDAKAVLRLMKLIGINVHEMEEADVTMRKLVNVVNDAGMDTKVVSYWDATNEMSLGDVLKTVTPLYLLANAMDVNTLFDVESKKVYMLEFSVKDDEGECAAKYRCVSVIVHVGNHFVTVFIDDEDGYRLMDDMRGRFDVIDFDGMDTFMGIGDAHVVACYMRVE